jgi:hypothetical protein
MRVSQISIKNVNAPGDKVQYDAWVTLHEPLPGCLPGVLVHDWYCSEGEGWWEQQLQLHYMAFSLPD